MVHSDHLIYLILALVECSSCSMIFLRLGPRLHCLVADLFNA
ncbi:MAG: hypothetical protein ABI068_05960 [Ktedonobacterales bacterium]